MNFPTVFVKYITTIQNQKFPKNLFSHNIGFFAYIHMYDVCMYVYLKLARVCASLVLVRRFNKSRSFWMFFFFFFKLYFPLLSRSLALFFLTIINNSPIDFHGKCVRICRRGAWVTVCRYVYGTGHDDRGKKLIHWQNHTYHDMVYELNHWGKHNRTNSQCCYVSVEWVYLWYRVKNTFFFIKKKNCKSMRREKALSSVFI